SSDLLFAAACGSSPPAPSAPTEGPPPPSVADTPPPPSAPTGTPRYDARTFYETVSMSGASFSADGTRILVSSDATGVFNVYAQAVTGGPPTQLTTSTKDSNYAISYFPKDDRFLFSADQGGNELTHIWVAELDGTVKDLTPGDTLKAMFLGWSKDKTAFYVTTNERDPKNFDLYRYTTDGYKRTL